MQSHSPENLPNGLMPMPYPTQRRHLVAKVLPYEILSVVVDPVFGLDLPFALRLAPTVQCLVANDFVDLPLPGFDLVVGLTLDLPLAVLVLGGSGPTGGFTVRRLGGQTSRGTSLVSGSPAICN